MGITRPITTSTGEVIALPQMSKEELEKRKKLQRILSRRKKGKNGRRQARMKLRRFDRYISNRRNDARHKATTRLVKTHGLIGIEDLQVKNMTKSARGTLENPGKQIAQKAGLNRRMLDVAPGEVRRQLEYKGAWYGTIVEAVAPHFTSQDCSACHARNVVARSEQVFECVSCGLVLCRDINAARNIEHKAIQAYGRRTGGNSPWIEPEYRSEAGTRKEVMIVEAMQTARSPCLQAGE
jgi:putative transposase